MFPEGNAATNRVHNYAKGYMENGINVHVLCFLNVFSDHNEGYFEGIHFFNVYNQKSRNKSFIMRRLINAKKYYTTFQAFRRINKSDRIIAIHLYANLFSTIFFAWIIAKLFHIRIIKECNEHPIIYYQGNIAKRRKSFLEFYVETKMVDGILCISKHLISLYKSYGFKDYRLLLVPSTVDPNRFTRKTRIPLQFKYIGYFGSLSFSRDNLDLLLKAYSEIHLKFPDIHLVIGGFGGKGDIDKIIDYAQSQELTNHIHLLGYLSRNEIVNYISNAEILVMVRHKDLQSEASFPSKLTEYLATGNPVLTVKVGDIDNYLTDNVNAFLVEPGDHRELVLKIELILENKQHALAVGRKGKELTDSVFNYSVQVKRVVDFIEKLN